MNTDETTVDRKSILLSVQSELTKARRTAATQSVKAKYAELLKAKEVVASIETAIVEELIAVGEDEAGIRAILAGE